MSLVKLELKRMVRRRGSFFGAMGFAVAIGLITLVLGDHQDEVVWSKALGIPLVFGATIVGALAGSYDTSQGTMRYLVLTGQPRWKLVALRVPALVASILLIAVPATLIAICAMGSDHQSATTVARLVVGTLLGTIAWGIVSLAVGTMLRSNGAGLAVAVMLFFAGSILTEVVRDKLSRVVGDYLLPNVTQVVGSLHHVTPENGGPFTIGLAAAAIALVLWLTAFTGAAVVRAQRDEY